MTQTQNSPLTPPDANTREHLVQMQDARVNHDTPLATIHLLRQMTVALQGGSGQARSISPSPTVTSEQTGYILVQTDAGEIQIPVGPARLVDFAAAGWQIDKRPIPLTQGTVAHLVELCTSTSAALNSFMDADFGWNCWRPVGKTRWTSSDFRRWASECLQLDAELMAWFESTTQSRRVAPVNNIWVAIRLSLEHLAQPQKVIESVLRQLAEAVAHLQQAATLYSGWGPVEEEWDRARTAVDAHFHSQPKKKQGAKMSAATSSCLFAEQSRAHTAIKSLADQLYHHCTSAIELFVAARSAAEQQF